ncbi:serine hydrolase [Rhodococcus triatomae]|uniref:CubicO group peptidase, beta-lactamase class C family n=1 Tax=Rhodococcus triatomae TaxID=300028 RepID=A0A1G7ZNE7_9NOCA|nr:serine hydrolase [Rhodococcus triatomae]QNG17997.1 serine hydrolase [Rhodococcus triatomae]QNG22335.1 serine hydrolase [Rhodococcus triatomae]SDH10233.1 CubicO group peptidase, beta-lactamase class C family [Rhodococcus triatomae]
MSARRTFVATAAALVTAGAFLVGCTDSTEESAPEETTATGDPGAYSGEDIPADRVTDAVGRLDGIADELMASSGVPGMAVAVVHGGETIYAKGFGVREAGTDDAVGTGTVFPLASLSKPVGATVVARQVGEGDVSWDTPVASILPEFELADPWVTEHVTVGDLYAHRSGLPDHAGDRLEDLGFDGPQVIEKLRLEPLAPFRANYDYTNFGLTAAADGVAAAAGTDWATLSRESLYEPLGMSSTSSRFADYLAAPDRAVEHQLVDGTYVAGAIRDPDAQAPAGGVSSSVDDMAEWMTMLLANGEFDGDRIVAEDALLPAVSPQSVSNPPTSPETRAGFYGYGFNVSTTSAGRVQLSHSGAFELGAATSFLALPSADVAIVALTNGSPTGLPETLTAEFADLVQYGDVREDWRTLYSQAFASMSEPEGTLVGQSPPADPAPPRPLPEYAGTYANDYWGPATVTEADGDLVLGLGPAGQTFPLTHWDGDTFTFEIASENAPPGTISRADFSPTTVTLEYFDADGAGTFTR